ncbi:response regulator transcription factor [Adhaeribacter pallidiroseus]|uniref:Chemotaxis response regulator protein-glutamate methylesterase n=1 Tax=Adhaeribacter pallidiroseus TaxID=2072847 RepID=A0A369QKW7_9BACT|nr:response regulator transcription factor [Adhaeribacter pallidiroseus]RDC63489.1 Chemotaxis response regulator protein-glutamate methylesterase [Adhaeribacter pallidiroseus]
MIHILLVDDHKIIRDGIKSLLKDEATIEVVGEASNAQELIEILPEKEVDVIIMDLNMPVMDGFEGTKYIKENHPDKKVLVLSMLDNENYISKVMDAGASGYILKNTGREEMIYAITTIAAGNLFICTEIALNLLKRVQSSTAKIENNGTRQPGDLSKREIEVLRLIAEGLTNAEIADKLFTSKRTIESHRQHLIEKTQAKNTAALVKFALEKGIID